MCIRIHTIRNKNEKIQSFATETSKINKELIEENKTLRDWANYKDIENKELANNIINGTTMHGFIEVFK